jgi:hypothetical protein
MMMMMGGGGVPTTRKYSLTISARANNLFNVADYSNPSGTLSPYAVTTGTPHVAYSSLFGRSQQLAGGAFTTNSAIRRVYLNATFSF